MGRKRNAWRYVDGFGMKNLRLVTEDLPALGSNQIAVKMAAASLNYRDLVVMDGAHGAAVQPPLIPLSDGAGYVTAVGENENGFAIGDLVCPLFFPNWRAGSPPSDLHAAMLGGPADGVLASEIVVDATAVIKAPSNLSPEQAACLPCAGLTAWSALTDPAPILAGDTVLILGTGGVAMFALAFVQAMGAQAIVLTSNKDKMKRLTEMGAAHVVNYKTDPKWSKTIKALTGGAGADRVIELGGAATLEQSIRAVRVGGTVVTIGNVTGSMATIPLPLMLTRYVNLQAVSVGHKQGFAAMIRAIEMHSIVPIVDQVFDFDDAPSAFDALRNAGHMGKICVSIKDA